MQYKYSQRSHDRLYGVHPDMVMLAYYVIQEHSLDVGIVEGVRQPERQKKMVETGASMTMNSRHLPQPVAGGLSFGHALDFSLYEDSVFIQDFGPYVDLARTVQRCSSELNINVTWGGAWMSLSRDIDPDKMIEMYIARKKAEARKKGKKPRYFMDGMHYELSWDAYPILKAA